MALENIVGGVTLTGAEFFDSSGKPVDEIASGATLDVRVRYRADRPVAQPVFGFSLATEGGLLVYGSNTQIGGHSISSISGEGVVRFTLGPVVIAPGRYLFSFSVHSADHLINYHRLEHRFPFIIAGERTYEGAYIPVRWEGP